MLARRSHWQTAGVPDVRDALHAARLYLVCGEQTDAFLEQALRGGRRHRPAAPQGRERRGHRRHRPPLRRGVPRPRRAAHPQRPARPGDARRAPTGSTSARTTSPVAQARALVGPDRIVGLSTHSPAQIDAAAAEPEIDYIGVGPVHATPTKPGRPAVGLDLVRYAAAHAATPFFAIGGIDAGNAAAVRGGGRDADRRGPRHHRRARSRGGGARAALRAARPALAQRSRKRGRRGPAKASPTAVAGPTAAAQATRPKPAEASPTAAKSRHGPTRPATEPAKPKRPSRWAVPTGEELTRSQRRDAEARANLKPIAPGERPLVIRISALLAAARWRLANLIAWLAGDKIDGKHPAAGGILIFSGAHVRLRDRPVAHVVRRGARLHGAAGDHRHAVLAVPGGGQQRARASSWRRSSSSSRAICSSSWCACSAGSRCRSDPAS